MADITIVFMGFINQLITGGHHPAQKKWFLMGCNGDLVGMGGKGVKRLLRTFTTGKLGCHKATDPAKYRICGYILGWLVVWNIFMFLYFGNNHPN